MSFAEAKNYALYKKDESLKNGTQKLNEAAGFLDAINTIADQYANAGLATQSKELKTSVLKYRDLFAEFVAAKKDNEASYLKMCDLGKAFSEEVAAFLVAKETQYTVASEVLAASNRTNLLLWQTRYARGKTKTDRSGQWTEKIAGNGKELNSLFDVLLKLETDAENQKVLNEARKAIAEYIDSSLKWVEEFKKDENSPQLAEFDKINHEAGNLAGKLLDSYMLSNGQKAKGINSSFCLASKAATAAKDIRLSLMKYVAKPDSEEWKTLNDQFATLNRIYDDLKKGAGSQEDAQAIELAKTTTGEYIAKANAWRDKSEKTFSRD
jgi:hypothetical protein